MAAMSEEKIPYVFMWPKEYKQGFNEYCVNGLEESCKDNSWYLSKYQEFELSKGWKKMPKDEKKAKNQQKNVDNVLKNHKRWLIKENKLQKECEFFGVQYREPESFPLKYETESGKQMNFVKNYYWCLKSYEPPYNLPKSPYYEKWNSWLYDDERRINSLQRLIEKEKKKVLKNQLMEKWYSIPEEVRIKIKKDYDEKMNEIRRRSEPEPRRYYTPPQDEYITACNGMVLYRDKSWSDERWREECSDFKQNMRDW